MKFEAVIVWLYTIVFSGVCYSMSGTWASNNTSAACRFLVSKYFPDFTVIDDQIFMDFAALNIMNKKGWFDKKKFYTFQSPLTGSYRSMTIFENGENDSWIASIPDRMLGCRMEIASITEPEKELTFRENQRTKYRQEINESTIIVEKDQQIVSSSSVDNNLSDQTPNIYEELARLRAQLLELKKEKSELQAKIEVDELPPDIDVISTKVSVGRARIIGSVSDNVGVAEVRVQRSVVAVSEDGKFEASFYVPEGGITAEIVAIDFSGLQNRIEIFVERPESDALDVTFASLDPLRSRALPNKNAIALVVGISKYENISPAEYADRDANIFVDYAKAKLGVDDQNVVALTNQDADITGMLLSVQDWLNRSIQKDKTDVYIFFAGHGLASDDGAQTFLIPYDGSPRLLSRTAISREELFNKVSESSPRSVTVFLDTCYSGGARGGSKRLITARPLSIVVKKQAVPDGFTVFTAAGGDQTAKPLIEAQHGMFSYFLMKGMEGDADANSDDVITAQELHIFVKENVVQQSGGLQVPELQGDSEKVLVRFQ